MRILLEVKNTNHNSIHNNNKHINTMLTARTRRRRKKKKITNVKEKTKILTKVLKEKREKKEIEYPQLIL